MPTTGFAWYARPRQGLASEAASLPFGLQEIGTTVGFIGLWAFCYFSFMDAFPVMRVFMMTTPCRDEVQVPVDARTMEPLPAHE